MSEETKVEVPAKFKSIVESIETMSVLDLNELVKLFEAKFGVSAAAVAVAGPAVAGPAAEEKSMFNVELAGDRTWLVAKCKELNIAEDYYEAIGQAFNGQPATPADLDLAVAKVLG